MADAADADAGDIGGARRDRRIAEGLEVDAERMRANLDTTHGLIMAEAVTFALAEKIGKSDAHHLLEAASKMAVSDKKHLRDVLTAIRASPRISARRTSQNCSSLHYMHTKVSQSRLLHSTIRLSHTTEF